MAVKKDISRIISTLRNSIKKHRKDHDFARLEWRIDKLERNYWQSRMIYYPRIRKVLLQNSFSEAMDKVTLFAELATRGIQIPDTNNHVENLMGIVGRRVKRNHQSWVDRNLEVMLETIWHILS